MAQNSPSKNTCTKQVVEPHCGLLIPWGRDVEPTINEREKVDKPLKLVVPTVFDDVLVVCLVLL